MITPTYAHAESIAAAAGVITRRFYTRSWDWDELLSVGWVGIAEHTQAHGQTLSERSAYLCALRALEAFVMDTLGIRRTTQYVGMTGPPGARRKIIRNVLVPNLPGLGYDPLYEV